MKLLLALILFLFLPLSVRAQTEPPEARPFAKGITSFEQYEAQKKQAAANGANGAGNETSTAIPAVPAKTPDKRQPKVEIWLPPAFQSSEEKWPLIVFSHGFGGCAKQSAFLTSYIAEQGYIVIAPNHADANCRSRMGSSATKRERPERPFRTPEAWTDKTEIDRRDDVIFALESMLDDRQYMNYVDLERIGLIGHSLGGYTALGLAGARAAWKDKRFRAVLALSPYAEPYLLNKGLRRLNVPVMYQGGTRDSAITASIKKSHGVYAQTSAPKYFIEWNGAGHFAWTDLERDHQYAIQKSALAFFDKHLRGAAVDIQYQAGKGQVATFWKDEGPQQGTK